MAPELHISSLCGPCADLLHARAEAFLTSKAVRGPGNRGQPPGADGFAAIEANPVISGKQAVQSGVDLFDRPITTPLHLEGDEFIMSRLSLIVVPQPPRLAEPREFRAHFRQQLGSFR